MQKKSQPATGGIPAGMKPSTKGQRSMKLKDMLPHPYAQPLKGHEPPVPGVVGLPKPWRFISTACHPNMMALNSLHGSPSCLGIPWEHYFQAGSRLYISHLLQLSGGQRWTPRLLSHQGHMQRVSCHTFSITRLSLAVLECP